MDLKKIPKNKSVLVSRRADSGDTVLLMREMVRQATKEPALIEFVRRHPMNENQIHHFVYQTVRFIPDLPKDQVVKSPIATIRTRTGNCVDMSTLVASLMKLNKIPGVFRRVMFQGDTMPSHIFVRSNRGKVVDCIQGQNPKGEKTFKHRRNKIGIYNKEPDYLTKFDTQY